MNTGASCQPAEGNAGYSSCRQHRRGIPVNLSDILPGIDRRNASLVVRAIAHAAGQASNVTTEPDGR
jgi:hypothetical protein